jgi:hypothetical protein
MEQWLSVRYPKWHPKSRYRRGGNSLDFRNGVENISSKKVSLSNAFFPGTMSQEKVGSTMPFYLLCG